MPRKKLYNPITLFYPNLLDVRTLSIDAKYHEFKVKPRDYYLLFHVLCKSYLSLEECENKFVPIHSSILRDILGMNSAKIMNALIEEQYIVANPYYSEYLSICKSYAVHPRLMDESKPLLTAHFPYDQVLHNKMMRIGFTNLSKWVDNETKVSETNAFDRGRQHVLDMTGELVLVPDEDALQYVKTMYTKRGNPNQPEAYFHAWNTNPMKGCGVDRFGKRVHSVVTNLPKVLRHCLRFKSDLNTPLKELDIVNSQPFFLSAINAALIDTFAPECTSAVPVYLKYEENTDYIKYRDLCASGLIYEEFVKLYATAHGTGIVDRTMSKELIYGVFFSDYTRVIKSLQTSSRTDWTAIKKRFFALFIDAFPSVYHLFNDLKSLYWSFTVNKAGEYKPYANNCLLAQRIESNIMFEAVVPALLEKGITDFVTIHDCVLVKATDATDAKESMLQTFHKLNLNPKIK